MVDRTYKNLMEYSKEDFKMNETLKVLESRRSCRKFKSDAVKEEDLKAIIKAGTYAASGMGKQSAIIIAVSDKELRDELAKENAKILVHQREFDPFYGAPTILIVLANKSVPTYLYDGSLVWASNDVQKA
jgi:Nitroreductase